MPKQLLRLLFILLTFQLLFQSCKKEEETIDDGLTTYPVAGLLSLSGNWSTLGLTSAMTMNFALEDINTYLKSKGATFKLSAIAYDTKLDTAQAKIYFAKARDLGYKFIIGPQSSAELAAIKPLAAFTDMLVISQGSTAGSLSDENDAIFRFCPPDRLEGAALAKTMNTQGIKGLLTFSRDDAGNKGLQNVVSATLQGLGAEVVNTLPYATNTSDFTNLLSDAKSQLQSLIAIHGASNTGIYLASFDECTALFKKAAKDPIWSTVKWYGGDGVVLSSALTADTAAASFAVKTSFFAPTFGLPEEARSLWEPLAIKVKSRTGIEPDAFALATYDALWVIAKTLETNNGIPVDFNNFVNSFIATANSYSGVTGATTLDVYGDRSRGTFDYWGIELSGDAYKWKLVGKSE